MSRKATSASSPASWRWSLAASFAAIGSALEVANGAHRRLVAGGEDVAVGGEGAGLGLHLRHQLHVVGGVAAAGVRHVEVAGGGVLLDLLHLALSGRVGATDGSEGHGWLLPSAQRSEEHTSELQSQSKLVCRPRLE